ncbi:MAG: DUF4038 domain-containing protein [Bacteroidales bacterium]|nr:DUF4038 domain-containing protein [Bacteroidales bacterium]
MVTFELPWDAPYTVDTTYKNYLTNGNGHYIFILNKTAWAYFACSDPIGYLKKAQKEGINTIRVALEGLPYYDVLQIDLWPWGGTRKNPDYSKLNESYWNEVENRVRLAGEMGIGIDLCLYLTMSFDKSMINTQIHYWKNIIQRLGKYSNILTWEIQNEYVKNEEFQKAAAKYFKKNDPYKRPVCTSDITTDNAVWTNRDWIDLAIVHTCTGSTPSDIKTIDQLNDQKGATHHLKNWYQAVARNVRSHNKPAFNNESGREKRHMNDDPVHRRKQAWIFNCSGCFWTHHSWDGCEGINDMNYSAPGSNFLPSVRTFFETIPFWTFNPDYTAVQNDSELLLSTMGDLNRSCVITYICTLLTGQHINSEQLTLRLPSGSYLIDFISPVSLETIKQYNIKSKSLDHINEVIIPDFSDDILVKISLSKKQ